MRVSLKSHGTILLWFSYKHFIFYGVYPEVAVVFKEVNTSLTLKSQSKHEIQCCIYGFQEVRRSLWMKWYDVKFVIMADIAPAPGGGWTAPGVRARGWAASGA